MNSAMSFLLLFISLFRRLQCHPGPRAVLPITSQKPSVLHRLQSEIIHKLATLAQREMIITITGHNPAVSIMITLGDRFISCSGIIAMFIGRRYLDS